LSPKSFCGIEELEREPEDRRDRAQRDVTLLPREADPEDLFPLVHALADDAEIGDRARVRTRFRVGEREARDLEALGEAREVVVLLLLGAVMDQELGRPQRIRTITVTAAVPLRVEIFVTISVCAKAEKPSPPYDFGMMMPRKPFSRMNFQTSGGRSMRLWVMSHSLSMPQSSSTGPSRKACSSGASFACG
jgi:hypothetical protein